MVPSWAEHEVSERDGVPDRIGRYVVRGRIGRGSMGSVYDALDPELDRPVAVKVIDPDRRLHRVDTDELAARFVREARLAARIAHPGVVTVHDAGRDGETLYLVMERVDGAPLSRRLERGPRPGRDESLEIVAQAAEALAAAHDLGVVHRDVKPSNLMLTAGGRVKVADFGVAKAIGEDTGLTRTGGTVGSPAYMAPEQVRGDTLDGRADLFSLGAVLYELLLGRRPFPAESITTLVYQILHHDPLTGPDDLGRLGEPLAGVLRDCLAKAPADRVTDGRTLAARLRAIAGTGSDAAALPDPVAGHHELAPTLVAEPEAVSAPPPPPARRRWWRWPAAGAAVLLGAALVVVALSRSRAPEPAAGPPEVHSSGLGAEGPSTTPPPGGDEETAPAPDGGAMAVPPPPAPAIATPTRSHARTVPTRTATPAPRPTPPIRGMYYTPGGVEFHVDPETALIEIDGDVIGTSDEWDGAGGGGVWRFPGRRGVHYVKISAPGHDTVWVRITVTPVADEDPVEVEVDLQPIR